MEVVFMNAMPRTFYSEINHRFFVAHVFDISPGPGLYGEECIEAGVTYFCLAFTEKHAQAGAAHGRNKMGARGLRGKLRRAGMMIRNGG
eukprot:3716785-Pyramimonas_sp.AAC.1